MVLTVVLGAGRQEVVTFLMRRGKIATLRSGGWAALSSTDLEGTPTEDSNAAAGEKAQCLFFQ
jgi:hypothetical protein